MLTYRHLHRVRYRECDPMGRVYHTHFVDHFEAARTEALRTLGLAYKDLEASGIVMPVIDLAVQYKRPAFYDDMLEISLALGEGVPRARLRIDYEVRRLDEAPLLAVGHVTLCFFDVERRRPNPAPPQVTTPIQNALAEPRTQPRARTRECTPAHAPTPRPEVTFTDCRKTPTPCCRLS
jgi:acyl-CoA thioester hydrolase